MTNLNNILSILFLSYAEANKDRKYRITSNSSYLGILALIPATILCLVYIYKAVDFPIHDFANYYFGAQFLGDGNFTSDIYFPYYFNKAISDLGYSQIFVSYAPNTPFLAVLFYPLTLLSLETAKLFFNILSCLLLLYSVNRLAVFYKVKTIYLFLIPIVFFVPIKNNILFGQVYFVLFFLLTEALLAYENKRFVKMAALLSLAIMLKIFPVIFILMLLFRKQFRAVFFVSVFCGILLLISLAFTRIDVWMFFITDVLPKSANGEIAGAFVDNYQSVLMFLKRIFVFDNVLNPHSIFNSPLLVSALLAALKVLLIVLGWFLTRKNSNLTVFCFWIFTAIILSPYGSTYTFVLLLVPFFTVANGRLPLFTQSVIIGLLFLVNNFPVSLLSKLQFPLSYGRLSFLVALFIVFVSFLTAKVNWKLVAGFAAISFIIVFALGDKPSTNQRHLFKNAPILIYDYALSNNRLTYFYWNQNGESHQSETFNFSNAIALQIKDNQIYNGSIKLTSDKSNKLKPMLLNNDSIILLSDSDRGIGFYTLKIIALENPNKQ